jgi:hypothetical protein
MSHLFIVSTASSNVTASSPTIYLLDATKKKWGRGVELVVEAPASNIYFGKSIFLDRY